MKKQHTLDSLAGETKPRQSPATEFKDSSWYDVLFPSEPKRTPRPRKPFVAKAPAVILQRA